MQRMKPLSSVALLLLLATAAAAQTADSGAFVVRLGNDTLVLERFVRTADRVRAEALIRSPATMLRHYDLRLNPAGGIRRLETTDVTPGTNAVTRREILAVVGDTAVQLVLQGDSIREARFRVSADALPFLNLVQWPNDLIIKRVGKAVGDSVLVPYLSGSNITRFIVSRTGADALTIRHPFRGVSRVKTDAAGNLSELDASQTTLKLLVERRAWLPLETLAPAFAARDANQARRELSPRGETKAAVNGANIVVDYGRPLKRGRNIFGNVVPFGQVWRTGANTATQFKTDRDLVISGKVLPAGQYSIFSIPQAAEWTIIINSEINQSGTAHKPERDFMRVPARVSKLGHTVEQFTIAVSDGALRFQWDDTEAVLPFTVK